jgi:hypothetical protein
MRETTDHPAQMQPQHHQYFSNFLQNQVLIGALDTTPEKIFYYKVLFMKRAAMAAALL